MKADREEMLTRMEARTEAEYAKFEILQNTLFSRMDAQHEGLTACLGKTEATDLEANPEGTKSEAMHREVPREHSPRRCIGRSLRKTP
jgi:hypothetical protein